MTREELKKEAGEYASIHARQYCHNDANGLVSSYREVYNAYYQSAEPREKCIEELDKENGKLEGKLADLQSEYIELENFKNNEVNELKAQIEHMKCLLNEIYSEYGFSELVKIRNDLPIEIQEVIKEIEGNG